ncbi:DUF2244 domain-containing protein [Jannaschia sp. S6380]|uniref:DUF2244 domain-containing protein n=1 Tax=Jannaschia sp. S6380 TaxID=2926408 RepID=UPI001FF57A10|nr:DUF2244 domain-containing protein [Jannaschia sp. S6380]MCK0166300.1 DUF2244 domain-containing protein [Jannaschia sp. S6380]
MPFRVLTDHQGAPASSGAFAFAVELWPHQSLTGTGFVWVIGATFAMLCIPLVGLLGTAVLWGVLPFAMGALALLWLAVQRNWRDRDIVETFTLKDDVARLVREEAPGLRREWQANPYWVRIKRHDKVGQVEDYLTLQGGPREVEIGAFLTPAERRDLEDRLRRALHDINKSRG